MSSSIEIAEGQRAIIFCNDSVYETAVNQVEFEAMPPISVKGKSEPIAIYRPLKKHNAETSSISLTTGELSQLIDRLSTAEQLTLKVASVIGQLFSLEVLSAIYPEEHTREQLQTHLQILADSGLIYRHAHESSTYSFKDSRTRVSAYNLMLFAQRRQLHHAMAELLEKAVFSIPPYAEIAHHWKAADEILKAVQYLEKAGEHAREMGEYEEATRFFNESLALNG